MGRAAAAEGLRHLGCKVSRRLEREGGREGGRQEGRYGDREGERAKGTFTQS